MSYLVLYSLLFLLATSSSERGKVLEKQNDHEMVDNCSNGTNYYEYCNEIGVCKPGAHIMCMYYKTNQTTGPACQNGRLIELGGATKQIILDKFNTSLELIRPKRDTLKLDITHEWDHDLALFAQVWANQCQELAEDTCRATKKFPDPAQMVNVVRTVFERPIEETDTSCINRSALKEAIDNFFKTWEQDAEHVTLEDIKKYKGIDKIDGEYRRNNFLTWVHGKTTHIGCGLSAYESYEFTDNGYDQLFIELVCNLSSELIEDQPVYDYELEEETNEETDKGTTDKTKEGTANGTTDKSNEETAKDTTNQTNEETAKGTTDKSNEETAKDTTNQTNEETAKGTTDKSNEETAKDTTNKTNEETAKDTTDKTNEEKAKGTTDKTNEETAKGTTDKTNEETAKGTTDKTNEGTTNGTTDKTNEGETEEPASSLTKSPNDPQDHTASHTSHAPKHDGNSSSEEAYQEGYGNGSNRRPTVLILPIITVEDAPDDKYLQKLSLINENLRGYSKKVLSPNNLVHNMNKQAIQKPRTSKKEYNSSKVLSPKNLLHSMNKQAILKPRTSKKGSIFTRVPTFHLPSENHDSNPKDNLLENVLLRNKLKALLKTVPRKDLLRLEEALKSLKRNRGRRVKPLSTISPLLNLNVYNEVRSRQNNEPDNSIKNAEKDDTWTVNTVYGNKKDRNRAVEMQSQFDSIATMRKQIPIVHATKNNVFDEKYGKVQKQGYFNLYRNDKSINNYIKDTNVQEQTGKYFDESKIVLDDSKSKRRMYLENEIYKLKRRLQHLRQYIRRNDISEMDRFRPVVEPHNRRKNMKLKEVDNFYMPDRAHSLHEF